MDVFEGYKVRKLSEFQRLVGVNKGPVIVFNATDGIMAVYQIKPAG